MLWIMVVALLAIVVWQDFKDRSISVWVLALLTVTVLTHTMVLGVFSMVEIAGNMLFIAVQLGLLNLLVYFYRHHWLMHGEKWIGWGDIVFFAVAACCFSTMNFIVYYVVSLLLVLAVVLAAMAFGRFIRTIPLAGSQAMLLMVIMMADYANSGRQLYVDSALFVR